MTYPGEDFWKNKKILITGGTSFVGKNLVSRLNELNSSCLVFGSKEYDLTKKEEADKVFQSGDYDFIIHMAALQAAADWPIKHPGIQFYVNQLIHLNSLEAWKNFQPQAKFIGIGSSCSFPGNIPVLSEEDFDNGPLHSSVYSYGLTKKALCVGIKAYKDQYSLRGTMPIFATLYGPHDDFNIETAHVVGALVSKFVDARKNNEKKVEVWGDGTQTRELIYVKDQIDGLLMAAQYFEGDLVNIGSGKEITIHDLAEKIKVASRFEGEIIYNPNKFVGVKHKVLNIGLAKDNFGWTEINKMHSLEEGLSKTVSWYESNLR